MQRSANFSKVPLGFVDDMDQWTNREKAANSFESI
jgi:hypothetical protein